MRKTALALIAALLASPAWSETLISNVNGIQVGPDGQLQHFGALLIDDHGRVESVIKMPTPRVKRHDQIIDGHGKTLLPGLIDAHGHVLDLGMTRMTVQLVGTSSVADLQQRVRDYAAAHPNDPWIIGFGWNQELWPDKRFPTAADLDAIVSDRPVVLERVDGHAVVANSAAMKVAGVTAQTAAPAGGRIENGLFVDNARGLIDKENVLLMFGSFGTPGNFAVRTYLNERQIPQLFVASGDDHLSDPSLFPWTMGWQPSIREEGRIYANYIQAFYPGKRIVALWQNDHVGRELFKGLQDGLGDIARMIKVDIAYDVADENLATHVSALKRSGAEIFVFAGAPANLTKVIRSAADLNWHPVFILNYMSSSIATVLKPAGPEKALGVVTATFLKDANDPAWKDEQAVKDWQTFIQKYNRAGGKDDSAAVFGYAAAETLAQVLKQCGDDLSRDNVMKQAAALQDYQGSILLPGIKINTGRWDFRPIKHLRLVQFDGRSWQPIGDVLETAFSSALK